MGVRVAEMAQDHFTDAFGIAEDVIIPEVKYVELTIAEIAVPIGIDVRPVLPAVDFDDQLTLQADEVGDIRTYRHLTPETDARQLTTTQLPPKAAFGIRHRGA